MATKRKKKRTSPRDPGKVAVLIEMRALPGAARSAALGAAGAMGIPGLEVDPAFTPVPMSQPAPPGGDGGARALSSRAGAGDTIVVRALVDEAAIADVERQPDVVRVWRDTPIAPFALGDGVEVIAAPAAVCPIAPCDCEPRVAKGTLGDVARYLRADEIWAAGCRGTGIVVAVVDGGITAEGRATSGADTGHPSWPGKLVPRVIGGHTSDWGTTGVAWSWHGNMCATDVLGIAPDARLYDIRISGGPIAATISAALAGFQWCLEQYRRDGTPQVMTNSWGIFQEAWDRLYARDPSHPFTRKVVEVLDAGILVLFAAGNCGDTCPDGRCGADTGPGRSIWGANGHPRVMTVGAANKDEHFIGYSSRGPAALDPDKPDFCGVSHFTGYFASDSGTSAATPVVAGLVALLKQAHPAATQDEIKACLRATAKDIGPGGFDRHSGAGIVQGKAAFEALRGRAKRPLADLRTNVVLDRRSGLLRDPITLKLADDRITIKPLDEPRTVPVLDVGGTLKAIDDRKLPIRDKHPFADRHLPQPVPEPEPLSARTDAPFILATPHHVQDWERLSGTRGVAQDVREAMALYEATLADLERRAEEVLGRIDAEHGILATLVEQFGAVAAEYQQLAAVAGDGAGPQVGSEPPRS
jgi:subtilisin family serine protease